MEISSCFTAVCNSWTRRDLFVEKEALSYLKNNFVPILKRKGKKVKDLETTKWGFLCCYNAQGQLCFNASAIYMQFYSGGVSMVSKGNSKTEHYFWATGTIWIVLDAHSFKILHL